MTDLPDPDRLITPRRISKPGEKRACNVDVTTTRLIRAITCGIDEPIFGDPVVGDILQIASFRSRRPQEQSATD